MTYQELYDILAQTGLPMALHHWEHPPKPPYGVYYDDYTDNFAADYIDSERLWRTRYDMEV